MRKDTVFTWKEACSAWAGLWRIAVKERKYAVAAKCLRDAKRCAERRNNSLRPSVGEIELEDMFP